MADLLTIEGLRVGYGELEVVRGADLSVSDGELVGLVGESGSGKSSLVRGALRLLPPPALILGGSVHFEGQDLLRADAPGLRTVRGRRIGLVPQSAMAALNPVLTVREHLIETLVDHGEAVEPARLRDALGEVDLALPTFDRFPHQLSGGMRQRVTIALALLLRPPLVIFDEPTTALDIVLERDLLDRIGQLRAERGFGGILITHDLALVARRCDRVAVMYQGEIVEAGPPAELFDAPQHPHTRALRDASRRLA